MKPFWFFFFLVCSVFGESSPPLQWGENVTGVVNHFRSQTKEIALTFDACGGGVKGSQYDAQLIEFLHEHRIPATLFINGRWIDSNLAVFTHLASDPLFEIANHGMSHKPLSVTGKSIYGITGTASPEEVVTEIEENNRKIESLTGKRPAFFRSGTAYYDEQAVEIAHTLEMEIGGFSILGDAGATFSAAKVAYQLSHAHEGDIIICHFNHPESGTREGIIAGVTQLLAQGFTFVRLSEVKDRLEKMP